MSVSQECQGEDGITHQVASYDMERDAMQEKKKKNSNTHTHTKPRSQHLSPDSRAIRIRRLPPVVGHPYHHPWQNHLPQTQGQTLYPCQQR